MIDDNNLQTCDYCGSPISAYQLSSFSEYDICNECLCDASFEDELPLRDDHCSQCNEWATVEERTCLCRSCFIIAELDG